MSKCLVTKLKNAVDNESLYKIGGFKWHVVVNESSTESRRQMSVKSSAGNTVYIRVIGDGTLSGTDGTSYGKTYTMITDGTEQYIVLSGGEYDIIIEDDYNAMIISCSYGIIVYDNINMFNYRPIEYIYMNGEGLTGTLTFEKSQTVSQFSCQFLSSKYRDTIVYNTSLKFKLSDLPQNLGSYFSLAGLGGVTGSIDDLSDKFKTLNSFYINACNNITGDIVEFLNKFDTIYTSETIEIDDCPGLSGNIANLNRDNMITFSVKCYLDVNSGKCGKYSWNGTRTYRLALEQVYLGEDVDAMLIAQAAATNHPNMPTSGSSWTRVIDVLGTKTSASDDAVQTLTDAGFTIKYTELVLD